jgi:hypothetical protein
VGVALGPRVAKQCGDFFVFLLFCGSLTGLGYIGNVEDGIQHLSWSSNFPLKDVGPMTWLTTRRCVPISGNMKLIDQFVWKAK